MASSCLEGTRNAMTPHGTLSRRSTLLTGTAIAAALWLAASAPKVMAACPGNVPPSSWPCSQNLTGTAAQTTDLLLAFRPSLGQAGQGTLTVQQVVNAAGGAGGPLVNP